MTTRCFAWGRCECNSLAACWFAAYRREMRMARALNRLQDRIDEGLDAKRLSGGEGLDQYLQRKAGETQ